MVGWLSWQTRSGRCLPGWKRKRLQPPMPRSSLIDPVCSSPHSRKPLWWIQDENEQSCLINEAKEHYLKACTSFSLLFGTNSICFNYLLKTFWMISSFRPDLNYFIYSGIYAFARATFVKMGNKFRVRLLWRVTYFIFLFFIFIFWYLCICWCRPTFF